MVITLNIQGASPDEIRETCKQFAEMGINNRVVIKPEDLGISQAPAPSPEPKKTKRIIAKRKHNRYTGFQSEYNCFAMAGWDHCETRVFSEVCKRLNVQLYKFNNNHHPHISQEDTDIVVAELRKETPRNLGAVKTIGENRVRYTNRVRDI